MVNENITLSAAYNYVNELDWNFKSYLSDL